MRRLSIVLLLPMAGSLAACASSTAGKATARAFERSDLDDVPLKRLAVWVVSRPPVEDEGELGDVPAFGVPRLDEELSPERVDPLMQRALLVEVEAWAQRAGYEVVPASSPVPRPTLRRLLGETDADALLVIRVVPVDRFSLFEKVNEQTIIDTGDPTAQVLTRAEASVDRLGRLLVGQAFLFEPRSRIRLWSRQIPDFPETGRLTADSPFLKYGFVADDVEEVVDASDKARRAADAFVPSILAGFPEPHPGDPSTLEVLTSDEVQRKVRRDRFYDRNHVAIELSAAWELPSITASARTLQDVGALEAAVTPLPDLGTGELAPAGVFELRPKAVWIQPGGLSFSVGAELGFIPNDYARTVFAARIDPPSPTSPDQAVELSASGGLTVGGSLAVGRLVALSPQLFLLPEVGAFVDVYAFDVSGVVDDATHVTLGGQGELSLLVKPSEDSPFYVKTGAAGRLGGDFMGGLLATLSLTAGVGLLY